MHDILNVWVDRGVWERQAPGAVVPPAPGDPGFDYSRDEGLESGVKNSGTGTRGFVDGNMISAVGVDGRLTDEGAAAGNEKSAAGSVPNTTPADDNSGVPLWLVALGVLAVVYALSSSEA